MRRKSKHRCMNFFLGKFKSEWWKRKNKHSELETTYDAKKDKRREDKQLKCSYPGRCWGCGCSRSRGGRGQGGPAVGGWRGGPGGGGVPGARFGASSPGPESGQTLRRSFREDELLPELQVGASTGWGRDRRQRGRLVGVHWRGSLGFLQQGAAEAASSVRESQRFHGCRHQRACMVFICAHVSSGESGGEVGEEGLL